MLFSDYIFARFLIDSGLTGSDLDYLRTLLPGIPESAFNNKEELKKLLNIKFPKEHAKLLSLAPASNFWNLKDWLIVFYYKDVPKEDLNASLIAVGEELEKIEIEAQLENAVVEDEFGKKPFKPTSVEGKALFTTKALKKEAVKWGAGTLPQWATAIGIGLGIWGINSSSKSIARAAEAVTPPLLIIGGTFLIGSIIWKYT